MPLVLPLNLLHRRLKLMYSLLNRKAGLLRLLKVWCQMLQTPANHSFRSVCGSGQP